MRLYLTLKFDRSIEPDKHYISPGGYEIVCKDGRHIAFDFEYFEGDVDDDDNSILCSKQKELDTETFPEAASLNEALKNGEFERFEEFFVYTGECDDPAICLEQVLSVCFELDDSTMFELNETQLQQINELIKLH